MLAIVPGGWRGCGCWAWEARTLRACLHAVLPTLRAWPLLAFPLIPHSAPPILISDEDDDYGGGGGGPLRRGAYPVAFGKQNPKHLKVIAEAQ